MELTLDRPIAGAGAGKVDSAAPSPRDVSSYSVSLVREPALRGMLAAATRNMGDAEVEELFRRYDSDRSGYIDTGELWRLLHTLGFEATTTELAQILGQADLNSDSTIDLKEFLLLIGRERSGH